MRAGAGGDIGREMRYARNGCALMNTIICCSPSARFLKTLSGIPDHEVIAASNVRELASRMVENPGASCVMVHLRKPAAVWSKFLTSVGQSFLYVEIAFIVETGRVVLPDGFTLFRGDPEDPDVFKEISSYVLSLKNLPKRGRQRFDWPLNGTLTTGDGKTRSCRVRQLSASGAFLEAASDIPPSGLKATLSVRFKDFSIFTEVEVLGSRMGYGNQGPGNQGPGFGVKFLSLTEGSQRVIDSIVKDELMRHLLNPRIPVRLPSLE